MGCCGGWSKGIALTLAVLVTSCGGTGGGPSDSGDPLVFQARGRLNLVVQPTSDPLVLTLIATLLDPQGAPFRSQNISFTAEFPDATFIPGNDNQGAAFTNDSGQAQIKLIAGLTTGQMRVFAEAPPALNIATGVTVNLTEQGFVSLGPLGIIPSAVTFINPLVDPEMPGPMTIFSAVGGIPPYQWDNSNVDLGRIDQNLPEATFANEQAEYTLIGPIPTDQTGALEDTITLLDASGLDETTGAPRANASVTVIFAECTLNVSPDTINFTDAMGAETAQITVTNGVPFTTGDPLTVTQSVPEAGDISFDPQNSDIIIFTVATPPFPVDSNTLLIRDSRNCTASVNVTVTVSDPVITPASVTLLPGQRQQFILTGGVPPYQINPSGGTVDTETAEESGGSFLYTAGTAEGNFSIVVTDARNSVVEAMVTIQAATLLVIPTDLLFCGSTVGSNATITILTGVSPFTATHTFNTAGILRCEEAGGDIGDRVTCEGNNIIYLVTTNGSFDPDSVVIRDSAGGSATVSVVINGEGCPDPELCGNGVIEGFEQCEADGNLGGFTCEDFAGPGATGALFCNDSCTIDSSNCQPSSEPICGNGMVERGEECDGPVSGTCIDFFGMGATGVPSCTLDCMITGCTPP